MARRVDVPHIAWPLRLTSDGTLDCVAQDTIEEVRQSVRVLRRTPLGARPLSPGVGVPDPTFTSGIDTSVLEEMLEHEDTGEPRATISITATPIDGAGRQRVRFRVDLADPETDEGDPDAEEYL